MNSEETSQAGEARTAAPELEDGMSFFMKSAADLKKKHMIRRFQMQLQDIAEIILIWLIVGDKPFCFVNLKHFRYYSDEHFAPLEGHKAQRSAARAKKRRGSHAHAVDESGGGIVYLDIDVHASQQSVTDLGSVEAALTTNYYCNGHLAPLEGHMAQRSAARVGESRGSQAHAIHESGGGVVYLDMDVHALQQSVIDQGSAEAALTTKHGVDVQNIVLTIFCALVVLSFTSLHGSSKGDYPEFIKLGLYIGYMNLIVLTFLALTAKKMSKVAVRVAAGMSITAVTIAAVYEVSDKVSIKCVLIMFGTLATLAIGVINWK